MEKASSVRTAEAFFASGAYGYLPVLSLAMRLEVSHLPPPMF